MRRIVQFIHPGEEHRPDRWLSASIGLKEWNCGEHKRKFLLAHGLLTTTMNGPPTESAFTFWGEWEPQSEVRRLAWNNESQDPRWLHLPRLNLAALKTLAKRSGLSCSIKGVQNTDPLVFGDRFRYVLCQQFRKTGPTKLRSLDKGDIVIFGSNLSGCFVIDTVFVIEVHSSVYANCTLPNWESCLHKIITMDLIEIPPWGLRLYASQNWCPDEPFSFIPCFPVKMEPVGFRRPTLRPTEPLKFINPRLKQGFKVAELQDADARGAWEEVVRQVLQQGCALATSVEEPDYSDTDYSDQNYTKESA